MRSVSVVFILLWASFSLVASDSSEQGKYCIRTRYGSCRLVHGRYGIYVENNGILNSHTSELLGTAGDAELDEMIYRAGSSFEHEIAGDFMVCPMSPKQDPKQSRTRAVQSVCVRSFSNTSVVARR